MDVWPGGAVGDPEWRVVVGGGPVRARGRRVVAGGCRVVVGLFGRAGARDDSDLAAVMRRAAQVRLLRVVVMVGQ